MAGLAHRSVSNIRPSIASSNPPISGTFNNPSTPTRTISSNYGSPSTLRVEEEAVVIQLGSRYLRAGFSGDALPKAVIGFGPNEQRRAGDLRQWRVGYEAEWRARKRGKGFGEMHAIWQPDLRDIDLDLVGDKIERAVREAFTKYLLIDSRPRRFVLALPSILPLPLLSTIMDTLFHVFQPPTISILSEPMLATVAAGVRAGLVVDIGWDETVITGVYEYREIQSRRSVRASKLLCQEMLHLLARTIDPRISHHQIEKEAKLEPSMLDSNNLCNIVSFEECEEVMQRMVWCRPAESTVESSNGATAMEGLSSVEEEDEADVNIHKTRISRDSPLVSIPLASAQPATTLKIPIFTLSDPCEIAFFADGNESIKWDDEELPLHHLMYQVLLQLPVDIRSLCMARIIFTGGGSRIPGLKHRALAELKSLVQRRGWDAMRSKSATQFSYDSEVDGKHSREAPKHVEVQSQDYMSSESRAAADKISAAAFEELEADPIESKIRSESKSAKPTVTGVIRAISSMGAWSGASLLSHIRIPAIVFLEREQWLQHGVAGASKYTEVNVSSARQSMSLGGVRGSAGERTSWTLGLWG